MYNHDYKCCYLNDDIFDNIEEDINEEAKNEFRDLLYREDLMNIFGLDNYDFDKINIELDEIFEKIYKNEIFYNCMVKLAESFFSQDPRLGLLILYSYDYMDLAHKCITEYINHNNVSETNMELLKAKVFA
jgi:hypothetical protein